MIHYVKGNLFDSEAEALVNPVNTVGVMGKGIALQFKTLFPDNFIQYSKACREKTLKIGKLVVVGDESLFTGKKIIINFPTKITWRMDSEYEYIEKGLVTLVEVIRELNIKSIAMPMLGTGNGGLDEDIVVSMFNMHLCHIECDIYVYNYHRA